MCGIVGFNGEKNVLAFLLDGLERLEYRGYDSSGVAILDNKKLLCYKSKGRIKELKNLCNLNGVNEANLAIGHTRWATHGAVNDKNAHPHLSKSKKFAVVHNGIIENHAKIREFLTERYFNFTSETDTECIAHLLDYYYRGNIVEALIKTALRLKGSYALAVLCADNPDLMYGMRKDSPLSVSAGMLASDMTALIEHSHEFIIPDEHEIAIISKNDVRVVNFNGEIVKKEIIRADFEKLSVEMSGYENFMLKEIYEQPRVVKKTLNSLKNSSFESWIINSKRIFMIGCGSAYHAGLVGKYYIEKFNRKEVCCEIASEFRYNNPIFFGDEVAIAISQSGETADTIAGIIEAKKNCKVLGIVNVNTSTLSRITEDFFHTLAGPEIAVATTKGYLCQAVSLIYLSLKMASQIENNSEILDFEAELMQIDSEIDEILENKQIFQQLSARFSTINHAFFIGRGIDYAICLEASLKLKEISYIHSQAYPAGELKHGTISLIENGSLVIAISTDKNLIEKMTNNITEVRSRGAIVLGITCFNEIESVCDYCVKIKSSFNAPLLSSVSCQLFAYYIALARNCDIDKPRNLAKSVTVE